MTTTSGQPRGAEEFPRSYRRQDGVAPRRVRRLQCSECPAMLEINDNGNVELPPDVVRRKAVQQHWVVGKNRSADVCPDCNDRIIRRRRAELKKGPAVTAFPKTVEEPRKMEVDDRRIVFAKLAEVWAGKDAGYATPWTDQAVAKDLGVPLAWVVEIRSSMFGEARDNSEIRDFLERSSKLLADANMTLAEAQKLRDEASKVTIAANSLNGTLHELRRAMEGLAVVADRIAKAVK